MSTKKLKFKPKAKTEIKVHEIAKNTTEDIVEYLSLNVNKFKQIKERNQEISQAHFDDMVIHTRQSEKTRLLNDQKVKQQISETNHFDNLVNYLKSILSDEMQELLEIKYGRVEHVIIKALTGSRSSVGFKAKQEMFDQLFKDALNKVLYKFIFIQISVVLLSYIFSYKLLLTNFNSWITPFQKCIMSLTLIKSATTLLMNGRHE